MQVPEALQNVGGRHGLALVQVFVPSFVTSHVLLTHMPEPALHGTPFGRDSGTARQVPVFGSQSRTQSFGESEHTTGFWVQTPPWHVFLHLFIPQGVSSGALVYEHSPVWASQTPGPLWHSGAGGHTLSVAEQVPSFGSQVYVWQGVSSGQTTGVSVHTPLWHVWVHLFIWQGVLLGSSG